MPIITRFGGGGGLNFVVKAYSALPENGKKNEIAVILEDPTLFNGWIMQAEQPTGTEGLVWIQVAAESSVSFYADKRVKVYPKSVKYYDGESWINTEAYIYLDEWVQFSNTRIFLYKYGEVGSAETWEIASSAGGCTVSESEENQCIVLNCTGGSSNARGGSFYVAEKKDLTDIKTLKTQMIRAVDKESSGTKMFLFASSEVVSDRVSSPTFDAMVEITEKHESMTEILLDIEELSGEKYVGIYLYSSSGVAQTASVREFWLE